MEEIDVLRVEHANDITTIQELHMCLEDEKRGTDQWYCLAFVQV